MIWILQLWTLCLRREIGRIILETFKWSKEKDLKIQVLNLNYLSLQLRSVLIENMKQINLLVHFKESVRKWYCVAFPWRLSQLYLPELWFQQHTNTSHTYLLAPYRGIRNNRYFDIVIIIDVFVLIMLISRIFEEVCWSCFVLSGAIDCSYTNTEQFIWWRGFTSFDFTISEVLAIG